MSIILHQHPSRVPVTLRGFVWADPFRSSTWNDFNKTQKKSLEVVWRQLLALKNHKEQQESKDTNEALNHFINKDNQVMQIKDEENKLEITLDTQQFKPKAVQIYVKDGYIHVEAKHEESLENGNKYSAQQWVRKCALPKNTLPETVVANLSSDGLLKIAAAKKEGNNRIQSDHCSYQHD
ncbi:CRYAB [Lepeophtheirus salmonis]|uniref:CRYAB n=1 Tax=Lepeophtheirus salmonis TaxID=72036 RepID=A0A7R8D126_LEPSM|nr:CRYAB [Lepeophtheirus salmonis]CAF2991362.1 CRYAB [Lepeophtheirus salmonis]